MLALLLIYGLIVAVAVMAAMALDSPDNLPWLDLVKSTATLLGNALLVGLGFYFGARIHEQAERRVADAEERACTAEEEARAAEEAVVTAGASERELRSEAEALKREIAALRARVG